MVYNSASSDSQDSLHDTTGEPYVKAQESQISIDY